MENATDVNRIGVDAYHQQILNLNRGFLREQPFSPANYPYSPGFSETETTLDISQIGVGVLDHIVQKLITYYRRNRTPRATLGLQCNYSSNSTKT